MGHQLDSCDFMDVLEEAAVGKSSVIIDLRGGGHFTDQVRDVVTENGENIAVFAAQGRVPLSGIANARRAEVPQATYDGKLGA